MKKTTRQIHVGTVAIGGKAPVSVQSMTNTKTHDVQATLNQIQRLADAGCELVRVAVPDQEAAECLGKIVKGSSIPVIADIHFDYRLALVAILQGIHGLRLNPGNIGTRENVAKVVTEAKSRSIPIRIGVNAGSLEKNLLEKYGKATPQAMVDSAMGHIKILEEHDFFDIKISLKAHDVPTTIEAYRLMSQAVQYPLHVGITEAGTVRSGVIKSAVGIGALLAQGIGNTIRVSLTGDPVEEVRVAYEILKALHLRQRGATLVSCPTCGRCNIDLETVARQVEDRLQHVDKLITVAVMGCVVNGPGEAREADIGIAGGKGEGLLFRKGNIVRKVPEEQLVKALMEEIDTIVREDRQ